MNLEGNGVKSVLKREKDLSSTLSKKNACEIDLEQGKKAGIKLVVTHDKVTTYVLDSGDVSYKECSSAEINHKSWRQYYLFMISKNFVNEKSKAIATDIDLNSV